MRNRFRNCLSIIWKWPSNYVRFSKGALFASGLIFSEAFLKLSLKAFLVLYVIDVWGNNPSVWGAVAMAEAFEGITMFFLIIAHHVANDRIGYFRVIIFTVPCLIFGFLVLWLSNLLLPPHTSNLILYIALLLLALGLAGECSYLRTFLLEQFEDYNIVETRKQWSKRQKEEYDDVVESRANLWAYAASSLGSLVCWIFFSSLDWKPITMVTFIEVAATYTLFCCGSRHYQRIPPTGRTAASRIIEAMRLLKLIPLWLLFIPYILVGVAGSTLFPLQSYGLDTRINPRISIHSFNRVNVTSLYVFQSFISFMTSTSSDFLIRKFWSNEETIRYRARFVRIGIGMLFAFGSCLSAWLVEVRRLNLINRFGSLEFDPEEREIPMKILWLAPQFALLGIASGLVGEEMRKFFYDRVPESMRYFEVLFNTGVEGIGCFLGVLLAALLARDWIGYEIDEGHFDKYFRMLAILNIAVVPVFIFLSYMCDWNIADTPMEEVGGDRTDNQENKQHSPAHSEQRNDQSQTPHGSPAHSEKRDYQSQSQSQTKTPHGSSAHSEQRDDQSQTLHGSPARSEQKDDQSQTQSQTPHGSPAYSEQRDDQRQTPHGGPAHSEQGDDQSQTPHDSPAHSVAIQLFS